MEFIRDFQRAWVCISGFCGPATAGTAVKNCLVTNISVSGAQVRGTAPTKGEYIMSLDLVPGTSLHLRAENIWVKAGHFGLKFIQPTARELFLLRALVWAHRREDPEDSSVE